MSVLKFTAVLIHNVRQFTTYGSNYSLSCLLRVLQILQLHKNALLAVLSSVNASSCIVPSPTNVIAKAKVCCILHV
jgi:hypothetical protein